MLVLCVNCKTPVVFKAPRGCTEHRAEQPKRCRDKKLEAPKEARLIRKGPPLFGDDHVIDEYIGVIARIFNVPVRRLLRKSSDPSIKFARYLAIYIADMDPQYRLRQMGRRLGISSHASIAQAKNTVAYQLRNRNSNFSQKSLQVFEELKIPIVPA